MRILVSGDWHLGKKIDHYSMLEEQEYVLEQVKEYIIDYDIELLIITGDIYDRAIPPKEAILIFDAFVNSIINEIGIKIIIISGNHDSYLRLSFGKKILDSSGFFIGEKFNGKVDKVVLKDDYGPINFFLIPFMPYQEVRNVLDDEEIKTFHNAYKKMIETIEFDLNERNILVTHAYVVSNVMKTETSDSEKTLALGGIEMVDSKLFNKFDFICLGHIHKPQRIGSENYRYAGSLMKYSFSEVNHNKSVIYLAITEKGEIEHKLLSTHSKKDFVVIKDYYDNIVGNQKLIKKYKSDYIKIILKDKLEIPDVVAKLRIYFDNILEFKYEVARDIAIKDSLIGEELAGKISDSTHMNNQDIIMDLFSEFARKTANYELSDSQQGLIEKAVSSVFHEEQDE